MSENFAKLDAKSLPGRLMLGGTVLFVLLFVWFSVRWQVGDMLAELTSVNQPNAKQVAETAVSLAPADPTAHWLAASTEKDLMTPDKIESSVAMFEDVVRRSPYDFRWWIELGRAYEQAEFPEKAETAFLRAVENAPSYTYPRWQLGNFYLRQGRSDEAFAELRRTTENNTTYREQVFSLAWEYFDKDPARVESLAADAPDVRATLALFYAARGSAENSLRVWNTLTEEQKAENPDIAKTILQGLFDRRYARQAVEFARQSGIDPEAQAETVTNGGFEKPIGNPDLTYFGWKANRGDSKLDMAQDNNVRHSGARSLRMNLKAYNRPEFYNLGQVVAVQPNTAYRVSYWVRTESLKSGGPPLIEIVNGNDDKLIAASPHFPTGTNDWQEITVEFTTPENCEGISLRTSRGYCGDACPMTGTFWLDDFRITRRG